MWLRELPAAQLLLVWQGALVAPRPLGSPLRAPAAGAATSGYQASTAAIYYYETLTLALSPVLTLTLTLTPTLTLLLTLPLTLSLPLNQASMEEIAKRVGLPSGAKWAFAAPSPATADASAASEKFAAPLRGDAAALAALQALDSPDTPLPTHPHPSPSSKPPWEHMHPRTVLRPSPRAMQALYQPHRDALRAMLTEKKVAAVWPEPGLGDPDGDALMKTVSISRWQAQATADDDR